MRGYSLFFYVLTIILNVCLLLPVVYSYGMLAPVHLLICYLSFSSLLKRKNFYCNWSHVLFALIPSIILLSAFFLWLATYSETGSGYLQQLITAPLLPLLTFGMCAFEFIILFSLYSTCKEK